MTVLRHTELMTSRKIQCAAATVAGQRVVLVCDEKQLDAVDAGKPFAQWQRAGMKTAMMDEIPRQKDAELREAVCVSLAGENCAPVTVSDGPATIPPGPRSDSRY